MPTVQGTPPMRFALLLCWCLLYQSQALEEGPRCDDPARVYSPRCETGAGGEEFLCFTCQWTGYTGDQDPGGCTLKEGVGPYNNHWCTCEELSILHGLSCAAIEASGYGRDCSHCNCQGG